MKKIIKSKKLYLLILILAAVTFTTTCISTYILYRTSVESTKTSLADIAQGEKSLIETLYNHGLSKQAILHLVKTANHSRQSIGQSGEFVIAERYGDGIRFIIREDLRGNSKNIIIPFKALDNTPINRALSGHTGSVIAFDYEGRQVLAGYTYFEPLKLGIVAKIQTDEFNRPFYFALLAALTLALLLVSVGAYLFIKISNPMISSLIKSESKFRSIFDNSPDALLIMDFNGRIIDANKTMSDLLDYNYQDIINKSLEGIILPEDKDKSKQWLPTIKTDGRLSVETAHLASDGRLIPVEFNAKIIDYNNRPAILGNSRDISERLKTFEERRLNELRMESLVKISHFSGDSIQEFLDFTLEEAIRLTDSNIGYIYFYDESLKEFTLNTWSKEVMGQCRVRDPQTKYQLDRTGIWGEAVRQRKPIMVNEFLSPNPLKKGFPDGHAPVSRFLTLPVIFDDNIVAVVGVANKQSDYNDADVRQLSLMMDSVWNYTIRRQAETAMFKEKERLSVTLQSIGDAVITTDDKGNVTFLNKVAESLTGWKLDQAYGRPLPEVFHIVNQETRHVCDNPIEIVLRTGLIVGLANHTVLISRDGSERIIADSGSPIRDSQGNIFGVILVFRDETEKHKAEEELIASEEKFRSLFETMTEGVAVHEFVFDNNNLPADYRVTNVNKSYELHTGLQAADVIGRLATDLYKTTDPPYFEEYLQVARTGQPITFETYFPPMDKHFKINVFSPGVNQFATVFEDITKRKKIELDYIESEERFRSIVENTQAGYFFVDIKGIIREVNSSWLRLYGFDSKEEIIGKYFTYINPFDSHQKEMEFIDGIMRGDKNLLNTDSSRLCRDGSVGYHTLTIHPVTKNGKPIGFEGFLIDTTESRLADLRLNKANDFSQSLIQTANAMILGLDVGGNITMFNKAAEDITGYTKDELLGKNWFDTVVPKQKYPLVYQKFQMLDDKGLPKNFENPILTKSGIERYIVWQNNLLYDDGIVCGSISFGIDITDRKLAEEALKESEIHFHTLADSGQALIWTSGTDKKCNYFNQTWLRFTGRTLDQEAGDGWTEGVHPDDKDSCFSVYSEAFDKRERFSIDYRLRRHDGQYRWVQDDGTPRYNSRGEFAGYIGHCLDITDRKLTEQALKENEEHFKLLFDKSPLGYQSLNEEGCFINVNETWLETLGYSRGEVIGKWFGDFLDPDYVEAFRQRFPLFISLGSIHSEFKMMKKDGSCIFVAFDGRIGHTETGEFKQTHCILNDITEQKLAEQALKDSEEKFRLMVDHLPDSVIIHSEGKIVFANASTMNFLGCDSIDDIIGKNAIEFVHPDYRQTALERIQKVYRTRQPSGFTEEKILNHKNEVFDVEIIGIPVNYKGRLAVQTITRDITGRKKAEKALKDSEASLKFAQSIAKLGSWEMDVATGVCKWSDEFFRICGFEPQSFEPTSEIRFLLIHPDDRDKVSDTLKKSLNEGSDYSIEKRIVRPDGEIRHILSLGEVLTDADNKPVKLAGAFLDITERKQAEEAIILSGEKWKTTFDTITDIITLVSKDHAILEINKAGCEALGMDRNDIIGRHCHELFHNTAFPIEGCPCSLSLETNTVQTKEYLENERCYLLTAWPIRDKNDEIIAFSHLIQDITDDKKAEAELIKAKEKAEESDRLKSSFLANMSHELRTPMVGILGFSQMLADAENLDEAKEMSSFIISSGKRLMETLNLILDLSRVESGESKLDYSEFDLVEKINEVITVFSAVAEKKDLSLSFITSDDRIEIVSSQKAIESVLNNLINNAIKFTNQGGITISAMKENLASFDFVVISVTDTGIGIDPRDFGYIFNEFRQASEGLGRSHEGTGLGLTLSKKYIEMLGGTITVDSQIDIGTTFVVRLPLKNHLSDPVQPEIVPAVKETPALPGNTIVSRHKKVLLVEDDLMSIRLIYKFLSGICDLDIAINANEAIEKATAGKYSVILMDINLGRSQNGMFATGEIRKNPNYRNTPIIAMTAYAMKGDHEEFISGGCTDYISKPFEKDEFLGLINKYLAND